MKDLVVFSGSAHRELAEEICAGLEVPLSWTDIKRFSNDCLQAQLGANCRRRDVYIIQPLVPPTQEHLMELLLMIDAARGASAEYITAVIPHYAYARSDKKDAPRISIGARLVADLLHKAGAQRVVTMALHSPQVHGMFEMPVDHLIYPTFYFFHHFGGRFFLQFVVAFALFPFYMCILRTRATEHTDHRLVQYMFSRMHRRIFLFVVLV